VSSGTVDLRFRPLDRGTFMGGVLMTLAVHALLAALVYFAHVTQPEPTEVSRDLMVTKMVSLGKPRNKNWLPRIVEPPKPKAPEPTIKVTQNLNAAPAVKEPPRPKDPEIAKDVKRAMDRARMLARNAAEEPPEGSLQGSATGTSTEASAGDAYATAIYEAIRRNWTVPTGLSIGTVSELVTDIRISISESGEILSPTVRKSSGNNLYDDSCMQAVQATRRVPPPPASEQRKWRRGVVLGFEGKELAR
jgi:TonB family protein